VLKFRSVRSIVIAPARTGSASSNIIVVIRILHANSGILSIFIVFGFILIIVIMKFNDLIIEEIPAK
jgi:hypothetical protein